MAPRPSTVGPVRAALRDAARVALPGVQVTIGRPPQYAANEVLIVGGVRGQASPGPGGSARRRDELYVVSITAAVGMKNSRDQVRVSERCVEMHDALDLHLRGLPHEDLGLLAHGVLWGRVEGEFELRDGNDFVQIAKGAAAELEFEFAVKAQI